MKKINCNIRVAPLHTAAHSDEPFIYRETAAAAPAVLKRPRLPPNLFAEVLFIAATCLYLHTFTGIFHHRQSHWLSLLPPAYATMRLICWLRGDKHSHFLPARGQQSAGLTMIGFAVIAALPLIFSLRALFAAAGGTGGHLLPALAFAAAGGIALQLAGRQWRILQKPLLAYQADNRAFILYRWQDFRHVASKTWPVENFRGIALRPLPIDCWQLLLLGKHGQSDILLEEGGETYLRQRQKILAQSSGMAMLEA